MAVLRKMLGTAFSLLQEYQEARRPRQLHVLSAEALAAGFPEDSVANRMQSPIPPMF
uniref:Uncharacterized protein n=1 Tax=Arundo donax TaxID=35708 RepID=A0A0A9F9N5_ARUDO